MLQKTPGAVEKILDKINIYPPDQLMVGVKSNAEALERCIKYGAVPKLNFNKPLTGPGLDADDLVGGVYGEGAQASRRWKEMTQGMIFENGQRKSAASHMIEGGDAGCHVHGEGFGQHGQAMERVCPLLDRARAIR